MKPIKVICQSNSSKLITGFGKNMRNILISLHNDPRFEVVEAANGVLAGADMRTPWKCYGTAPSNPSILAKINGNPAREQAASYGFYCIDEIIEKEKPDIFIGIEDIWAFRGFSEKHWWNTIPKIIWTTIDSVPILPEALDTYKKCDKFLVWASFAEEEMKKLGCNNVSTLHGAIDLSNFKPLPQEEKEKIRAKHGLTDEFIIGFVFKNQLRKSVPNLLEGFKRFKARCPKTKLLLHTDWSEIDRGWDIKRFLTEKEIPESDVLASYVCKKCHNYFVKPYVGESLDCQCCGSKESVFTKTSGFGVSEEQLNEIYNLMDVYCHPFTSGGQEIPIQEAKAAGLIALVTDYSCGTDSAYLHQGGLPLDWHEYREPNTQFVKATTCPESILQRLTEILEMDEWEKNSILENGKEDLERNFAINVITDKLKRIIIDTVENFKPVPVFANPEPKAREFGELLDQDDKGKRIAIVLPQSAEDVFLVNSLIGNVKSQYPDYNIYFITKPEYFELIEDNPHIHKLIPFQDGTDDLLLLEGRSEHEGYFEIAFLPHATTQKFFSYQHNGLDKIQFEL